MGQNTMGNINRSVPVDLATVDYENEQSFFIRSGAGGVIKYCPQGNLDSEAITKTVDASAIFNDPELCRKIFKVGTTATDIHIGFGV